MEENRSNTQFIAIWFGLNALVEPNFSSQTHSAIHIHIQCRETYSRSINAYRYVYSLIQICEISEMKYYISIIP